MKSQYGSFSILQRIGEKINQLLSSLSASLRDSEESQRHGYQYMFFGGGKNKGKHEKILGNLDLFISPVFQKTLLSSNILGVKKNNQKENLIERILRSIKIISRPKQGFTLESLCQQQDASRILYFFSKEKL